ncbi:hypothetical protein J7I93_00335 [Bacillus sp. ISL-47]|uniref:hypothetical protein n=1 Tax=Bacillus sp. ISL-47 TaxID=2819130 RepID=UPI001BE6A6F6|nr:hypothetical protein [Bacillus sp. ISL-47]MBT2686623.1 hypothetical protein [Bacillus sp. ISL-47]MBT2707015.1 hypothetical protein [Pseudomonas sp. ISL-84]
MRGMSSRRRFDNDNNDVAGVFDRDRRRVLDVDEVLIRADRVIVVENERKRRRRSDRDNVQGAFDRDNRRRNRCCWF